MKFLGIKPLFLCSVIGLQALLVSNTACAIKASSIFQSPSSGKGGNCDSRDVDMMVTEAATLAQNAINSIDTLLKDDITLNDENKNIANAALAFWGIKWEKPWFKKLIKIKEGTDTLKQAKGNYQLVLDKLTSNSVDGARLVCGDKDWKWVTHLKDVGLTPGDKLISDQRNEDPADNPGYYVSREYKFLIPSEKLKSGYGGGLCDDSTNLGTTWSLNKHIMMCDRAFDEYTETLAGIISDQDSMPTNYDIDKLNTPGGIFLHEMMHWIQKQIVDITVKFPDGTGSSAYNFELCAGIAVHEDYVGKAVVNADNYRLFALAATLNQIDWSEGKKLT